MAVDFNVFTLLAQARPAGTGAVTAYTKPANALVTIVGIIIANTTGSAATYSIYVDSDGSTYDQTTAILYDTNLNANQSDFLEMPITLDAAGGTLGIKTGTGNALTFTIIGQKREIV